jgi:hypothetical protein
MSQEKDYKFEAKKPAPTDKAIVESQGDGWFVTNRKAQDNINLIIKQRDKCFDELNKTTDFLSPKLIIGGVVLSIGVGFMLGLALTY